MSIDNIDRNKEDQRRLDDKRADNARDARKTKANKNVGAQFQGMLQNKGKQLEKDRHKDLLEKGIDPNKEGEDEEGGFLNKIIDNLKTETSKDEELISEKKEDKEIDELEEDDDITEVGEELEHKAETKEHKKVDALNYDQERQQGEQGGREHGQQEENQGEKQQQKDEGQKEEDDEEDVTVITPKKKKPVSVRDIERAVFSRPVNFNSQRGPMTDQLIDQMVDQVQIGYKKGVAQTMTLTLTDDVFNGLSFRIDKTDRGVILTFYCPNNRVKDLFLLNRPKIYTRFKKRNLKVVRIDIE